MPRAGTEGTHEQHFERRLRSLDVELFAQIGSPGWRGDAASLLALHAACRDAHGTFAYLEIGSYLGASLQAVLADDRCTSVTSIDPRREVVRDDRGAEVSYSENSTVHMLTLLEGVPGADLSKLRTFERTVAEISLDDLPEQPRLCFVDGEHTRDAVLADARFCRDAVAGDGAVVFHDRAVVAAGIAEFLRELQDDAQPFFAYALPYALFVVELGALRLATNRAVRDRVSRGLVPLWSVANSGDAARRVGVVLQAEAAARRSAPGWVKRAAAAALSTLARAKSIARARLRGRHGTELAGDRRNGGASSAR